jgi:TRAP-type transport system periplasmic protein
MNQTHKIRWLIYHEPIKLFLRTAEAFSAEIKKLTDGRIDIEIYTWAQYEEKFSKGKQFDPIALIQSGEVQMSQMQVSELGFWHTPDFFALELPFLFRDHDHATQVLDGKIGADLLASLAKNTPAKGLAFTYSGGYRVMATGKELERAEDLKGVVFATDMNPVRIDTAKAFGCEVVTVPTRDISSNSRALRQNSGAIETTLPRYELEAHSDTHQHVINTKHSMFLTSIIVATDFWSQLSQQDQDAMQSAALHSARLERQWSVEDAVELSKDLDKHATLGMVYHEFNEIERDKLKAMTQPIYEKYQDFFSPGLVNGIINTH